MNAPPPSTFWPTLRWEYAAPAHMGVSAETLREMVNRLQQVYPPFHSLLVVRNGQIIFEAENDQARTSRTSGLVKNMYMGAVKVSGGRLATFQDQADQTWNVRSVTNSIISLLVGIALKKGLLNSLDDPAFEYLPETFAMRFNSIKRKVTLRHLLTMTSGLRSTDTGLISLRLLLSRDCLRTCLRLPMQEHPGERPRYNSANVQLLSGILARVSGLPTAEFARRYLFEPLGIQPGGWEADPRGETLGTGNLFLSLADMVRIGYLVQNQGYWESETIIPEDYLQESLQKKQSMGKGHGYGYHWYLREEIWQDVSVQVISAGGAGGQRIFVVPALNLVAAVTSRTDFAYDRGHLINQAVSEFLLPSVSQRPIK